MVFIDEYMILSLAWCRVLLHCLELCLLTGCQGTHDQEEPPSKVQCTYYCDVIHWRILVLCHRFSLSDAGASLAIRLLQQSEGNRSGSQPNSAVPARTHTPTVHSLPSATTSQLPGRKRHSSSSPSGSHLSPAKKSCSSPSLGQNIYSPTMQSSPHCIVLGEHWSYYLNSAFQLSSFHAECRVPWGFQHCMIICSLMHQTFTFT